MGATHQKLSEKIPIRISMIIVLKVIEYGCVSNYEMINGKCEKCLRPHAQVYESTGNCIVAQCDEGFHPHGDQCEVDVVSCATPNASKSQRTWNSITQTYGICTVIECNDNYHIESNACVPDEQLCAMPNGVGKREWNGNTWGACEATSCAACRASRPR